MLNFCVLRALLKSTFLKKKSFLKSTILKKKNFLKSMFLNEKLFVKSVILNKTFSSCQILNQLSFNASDFDLNIIHHVRFRVYLFCSLPNFHLFNKMERFAKISSYGVGSVSQVIL